LAQLTFNRDIQQSINESNETYETVFENLKRKYLKKLSHESDRLIFSNICQVIELIKWNLKSENQQANSVGSRLNYSQNQRIGKQQHIMISYHSSCRELCIRLKRKLESMGHKIWIDVNTVSDLSLKTMENAIRNSFCVLMCVNENYRQSIYCQMEAKYALKLNKPIIPLIMQQDYEEQKGWLGFMSDKLLVDFMKNDFVECTEKLRHFIDLIKGESEKLTLVKESDSVKNSYNYTDHTVKNHNENHSSLKVERNVSPLFKTIKHESLENSPKYTTYSNDVSAMDWTEEKVKEWFVQNDLNLLIFEYFKPFNGKMLKQLYDTKLTATDFYFKSLSKIENFEFKDIISFGACLDDLFDKKIKIDKLFSGFHLSSSEN